MKVARVVAIKCPACDGSGKGIFGTCMWCEGAKKLRRNASLRWAEQSILIGSGGYICGDHDWDDRCKMVNKGNEVRRAFGLEPRS